MFATLNQQTTQAISAAENLVEQLKQQLVQAQDTLNSLYQQQQLEQTAQGTVQTALDMAHKAYRALETAYPNNPEAISEFEQAFLSLRNRHRITEFEHPLPTIDTENDIIDVTPPSHNGNGNGNGHHAGDFPVLLPIQEPTDSSTEILSVDELKVLPRETLRTLCSRFNLPKNGHRLHLAKRLVGKVTVRDVPKPEPELEF